MDEGTIFLDGKIQIAGIAHLAVSAADLPTARRFYCDVLGFEPFGSDVLPGIGTHALLKTPSGQYVALSASAHRLDLRETAVHQAYRISASGKEQVQRRLIAAGVEIFDYKEDRPEEEAQNFYFFDPDGNRLQLVVANDLPARPGVHGIDHAAVIVSDMQWADRFYSEYIGLPATGRTGWRTGDNARARQWAAGKEYMAPGTRRLDKLYMKMAGENEMPRANAQLYFSAGRSAFIVALAMRHFQEPPEERIIGAPVTAFSVPRPDLDRLAESLARHERPFEGPVEHGKGGLVEASLYCKDYGGNFLEFCSPRARIDY